MAVQDKLNADDLKHYYDSADGINLSPGWLGVYIQDLDSDLKESLKTDDGALVSRVVEDSPAEKAGIQEGDVIVSINKDEIADTKSLQSTVKKIKPGTDAKISVLRKGKKKNLKAKIGEREEDFSRIVIQDLDIKAPDVDIFRSFSRNFKESGDEFKKEMEKFKKEMKNFRKDMQEMKKELSTIRKKKI